ncbi:MAG: nitrile hydratase subunit beta [Pseudomonadota bacterium]
MNGPHDMGGEQNYGPVRPEPEEPIFHAEWEARALAITLAVGAHGRWNIDMSRFAREALPPALYLNSTYYERWIAALEHLMVKHGLLTAEELSSGRPDGGAKATPPLVAERVPEVLATGGPTSRPARRVPQFGVGDRVRTRNLHPATHTRLPKYARGKTGEIVLAHGPHVFADASALAADAPAEPLYAVRFAADELWGPDARFRGSVTLDLWEPHLERT